MVFNSILKPCLFQGKVAIVTGGATGIGKAVTEELLYLGAKVMIASRNEQRLKAVTEELKTVPGCNGEIDFFQCSIRQQDQVKSLVAETIKRFGKLDFLVNNGGGQFLSSADSISPKGFHAVLETNLYGTFYMCQEAYHQYMQKNGGAIVNMSMDNFRGYPLMAHSGAARAAVENLTKSLAIEWADSSIRVNSVAPGNCVYSETAASNYGSVDVFSYAVPELPAQRLADPEEVASVICFLLSPGASYISGINIPIDAGSRLYTRMMYRIPEHKSWSKPLSKI